MTQYKEVGPGSAVRTVIRLVTGRPVPCSASTGAVLAIAPRPRGSYAPPAVVAGLQSRHRSAVGADAPGRPSAPSRLPSDRPRRPDMHRNLSKYLHYIFWSTIAIVTRR